MGYRPSKICIRSVVEKIYSMAAEATAWQDATALVGKLNRALRGWANYFKVGTVNKAYRAIDNYTMLRFSRWLRNKHKVKQRGYGDYPPSVIYETLGRVRLTRLGRDNSWAKA